MKTLERVSKDPNDLYYTPNLDSFLIQLNGINQSNKNIIRADAEHGFIDYKVFNADGEIEFKAKRKPQATRVEGEVKIFGEKYSGCSGCRRKSAKMSEWWLN